MGRGGTAHGGRLVPGGARGDARGAGRAGEHHAGARSQALGQGSRQRARPAAADHRPAPLPRQRHDADHAQHPRGGGESPRDSRGAPGGRGAGFPPLRGKRILRGRSPHGGALRALSRGRVSPRPRAMAGAEPALGAREPGVHGGCGMSAAVVTVRPPTALALLLTVAAVLLIGSGVSYTLLQARSAAGARVLPVDALYNLALDAGAAVAGDAAALTRFQQRQKALEDAAARDPAAPFMSDARVIRLMSNAATVLSARGALAEAGSAARATAQLVPRLLTESGALGASLPAPLAPAVSATLERFEARAQRLELDVTALTRGAAAPGRGTCAVDRGARRDAAHAPRGRAPARLGGCPAPRERPQPAGDPAPPR